MTTPTPTRPTVPPQLGTSLVRTIVPMIVGWLLGQLAARGLHLDPGVADDLVTWAITAAYYVLVRVAETRLRPLWGWLLGLPKAPTYDAKAAPSKDSPTGAVATEDTDGVPAGAPVEVTPAAPAAGETYAGDSKTDAAFHDGSGYAG